MTWDQSAWELAVIDAAECADQTALAALWAEGQRSLGDQAPVVWARAISGLDSSAVTG